MYYDDDDEDEFEPEPQLETEFPQVIVIDNLPQVPQEKFEKLKALLLKYFGNVGPIFEDGFYMPSDPQTGQTKGFAFVEYKSAKSAKSAVETLNQKNLGKNNVLSVNFFEDIGKSLQIPDEYVPPQPRPYEEKENPYWWLQDPQHLTEDQFIIRQGDDSEAFWYKRRTPISIFKKKAWTESFLAWSPKGTHLATFHAKGIILWGGQSWKKYRQFEHLGVKLIDFSPLEKYLVTYAPSTNPAKESVMVWDLKLNKKIKGFAADANAPWPYLKWSHDDRFFSRLDKGHVETWEAPSGASFYKIKSNKVQDFCWSPTQNTLSYWLPEGAGDTPARVVLVDVPKKKELRQKNLFSVNDCKMHWQSKGEYLCVKVDRYQSAKTKKSTHTNFEIFYIREKDIPIEVLEIKQTILAFAFEPNGSRFAIIHNAEGSVRPDVSFYEIQKSACKHLTTLEKKACNLLFWSPMGSYIVLAGLKGHTGSLEFFSVNELETLGTGEHYAATDLEWDPSGRFVATSASAWRHQLENGYCIWSFRGKLLNKIQKEKFYQFLWRPRPPTLLSDQQLKDLKEPKNLRVFTKKYIAEEKSQAAEAKRQRTSKRDKLKKDFADYLAQKKAELAQEAAHREKLRGPDESPEDYVLRDVEEILEEFTEVIDEPEH